MYWTVYCNDAENSHDLRQLKRGEHSEYLRSGKVKILLAGPLLDNNTEVSVGSFFLIENADLKIVKEFVEHDPFFMAGVWASVDIRQFKRSDASSINL